MHFTGRWWWVLVLVFWGLVGTSACGGAQKSGAPAPEAAGAAKAKAAAPASRGFFYELSADGATVFLLGSVHVANREFYPLDPPIESAFAGADTLVLEIDLSDKEKLQKEILQVSVYPQGDSIDKHLEPAVLAGLRKYFAANDVPFDKLSQLKPWTVAVIIIGIEFKKAGFEAEHGIDMHFANRAEGKQVIGLETADEQLTFFTSMDETTQNLMLKQILEEVGKHAKTIDSAAVAWLTGDEQLLDRELLEPLRTPEYQEVFDSLFIQRNIKMTKAIEGLLKRRGTHFVVVGAGHVIGKQGIVDLLRSKGYTVERR